MRRARGYGGPEGLGSGWQELGNGTIAGGQLPTSILTLTDIPPSVDETSVGSLRGDRDG
jgi:hypothetical protein